MPSSRYRDSEASGFGATRIVFETMRTAADRDLGASDRCVHWGPLYVSLFRAATPVGIDEATIRDYVGSRKAIEAAYPTFRLRMNVRTRY